MKRINVNYNQCSVAAKPSSLVGKNPRKPKFLKSEGCTINTYEGKINSGTKILMDKA